MDLNNVRVVPSHSHFSGFLAVLVCILVGMLVASSCILCATCIRRKLKKGEEENGMVHSDTAETLLESALINSNNNQPIYRTIDVCVNEE
ncbi:unnamed protein product [Caenorhabditis auriculariae]|uniref:Uncharacterized protein n=1 Tax=Caenorhabditis auriculariae TaxID=2777116 RepID=A0A8S1HQI3_9PELO|nr:unnamed protein product [Caenorhabditis auriculariae]